jgi:acyl carrier protein
VTDEQILADVTEICRQIFADDSIVLTMDSTAEDVEGWDSFNHINILVAVEVRYGIKFHTAEVEEIRSLGQLVQLIRTKLKG